MKQTIMAMIQAIYSGIGGTSGMPGIGREGGGMLFCAHSRYLGDQKMAEHTEIKV